MILSVIIVGGGLAGVAAAVRLAEAGIAVRLIESSPTLGGRATPIAGVGPFISGGNTNFLDLLVRLDLLDTVIWLDELPFLRAREDARPLRAGWLPAPFHARPYFVDAAPDAVTRREVKAAFKRLVRMTPTRRFALRETTAQDWLESLGQSSTSINTVWRPWCEALLHEAPAHANADTFVQVIQEAMLPQRWGGSVGEWILPVSMFTRRVAERLKATGGDIEFETNVNALAYDGQRIRGAVTDRGTFDASSTIVATPPSALQRMSSKTFRQADRRLNGIASTRVPQWRAVSLTLPMRTFAFSRALTDDDLIRWIVDAEPARADGQRLTLVLSPGHDAANDETDLLADVMASLARLIPRATGLEPVDVEFHRSSCTTCALDADGEPFRPAAAPGTIGVRGGGVPNLYLAGDWCETDWPASVESAVRSGYAAAGAILGKDLVVGTLPPTWVGRMLGLRPGGQVAH